MPLTKRDPENKEHYVIVGGGPAGLNCAETLRQSGFSGQITIVSKEKSLPYDRTLLSKAIATGDASKWDLRPQEFLSDADIDVKLNSNAFCVKPEESKLITTDGDKIIYDKLLIATGSNAWAPPVEGIKANARLNKVHALRTKQDMEKI
jgi:apoptosis-inducing factor 3